MTAKRAWLAMVAAGCVAWGGAAQGQGMQTASGEGTGGGSGIGIGVNGFYWHGEDLEEFDLDGFAGIRVLVEGNLCEYLALQGRVGVGGATVDGWERDWHGYRYDWDYTYTIVPLELGLMLRVPLGGAGGPVLYGGPGVGCYVSWQEVSYWRGHHYEKYDDSDVEADFGAWATVGLRIPLVPGVNVDVQGEYHWLETEMEWEEWKADVDLDGWGFGVGLTVEL